MDFEEREQQRRRQMIKVIVAEIGMMVSVITIVVVATLAAMGFFVTSSGKIEQSGLVQIHSAPTGATVELGGNVIFSRTNLSRSLTPGEHSLKLSREGYDSWQKNIKMSSGMLLRLYYPRLFLLNRKPEMALKLEKDPEFYLPSHDRAYILYAPGDSARWNLINIRDDEPKVTQLDLTTILPGVVEGKFLGKVESLKWNNSSDSVLVKVAYEGKAEWILIRLNDLSRSLNLTRTFGLDFTQVEMIDDSAAQLFALENQQLRRINTSDQSISRVLLNRVMSFANSKTNVVYIALQTAGDQTATKAIGVYRDGEKGGTILLTVPENQVVAVAITRYYDDDYLAYAVEDELNVQYGVLPSYRENAQDTDFSGLSTLIDNVKLKATPVGGFRLSPDGGYIVAAQGQRFTVMDLEMGELIEYETMTPTLAWLNEAMMTAVVDDSLWVWDFDYTNRREMVRYVVENSQSENGPAEMASITSISQDKLANYPAVIANNGRWMYYLVETKTGLALMREKVAN